MTQEIAPSGRSGGGWFLHILFDIERNFSGRETDHFMQLEVGKIYEGKVTGITKFGAFVELEPGKTGMVHISEVANTFVNEIREHLTEGQMVKVKVLNLSDDGKISLSVKRAVDNPPPRKEFTPRPPRSNGNGTTGGAPRPAASFGGGRPQNNGGKRPVSGGGAPSRPFSDQWQSRTDSSGDQGFEDMLSRFKSSSEEKQGDLRRSIDHKRRPGGPRRAR